MTLILCLKILIPCNPSVSATPAHADKGRGDLHLSQVPSQRIHADGGNLDVLPPKNVKLKQIFLLRECRALPCVEDGQKENSR